MSEIWAKLTKKVSIEHVADTTHKSSDFIQLFENVYRTRAITS